MGLLGVYAMIAASVATAIAAVLYAVRRADALAWCLASTSVLSAALFGTSNWAAVTIASRDPAQTLAIMRVVGPASQIVAVLFGAALVLVLLRESKRPV